MGYINHPEKVKLITGLIGSDTGLFPKTTLALERAFKNPVDYESPIADFIHTDYYHEEMGPDLKRRFLSFKKLISLEDVHILKLKANKLEKVFTQGGMRRVNIDPGYIALSKLVLFSTKDYTHRMHIAKGIFAEVTLYYQGGTFNPWPWTYPDYRTKEYIDTFTHIRGIYKKQGGR